jgi:hypothetical protein
LLRICSRFLDLIWAFRVYEIRFHFKYRGGIMAATTAPSAAGTPASGKKKIGYFVQLGGAAAFVVGAIVGAHHLAVDIFFVGGAAAFYVGHKLSMMTS